MTFNVDDMKPMFRGVIDGEVIDLRVISIKELPTCEYNDRKYMIISISDEGADKKNPNNYQYINIPENENLLGVLELEFDDMESDVSGRYKLMSEEQAKQIVEWIASYSPARPDDKMPLVVVQCYGGICRSSGVAAALSLHYNGNDEFFWDIDRSGFIPNTWVYAQMTKALSGL
jgi:protein-tyrosine phosphatase